ncbi:MAG TPA: heme-binding protein [Candidatus Binatia bacterium]|nr:heme-binding protein [Candidatus Binatia bacterium]
MIGTANVAQRRFGKAQKIRHSLWLLLSVTAVSLFFFGNGRSGSLAIAIGQEKPVSIERATRPLIRVPTHLTLEEARLIIEAAKSVVKAENGRAAIAVVDFNGNLVSLDSMDGTSGFWIRFAIGKAMGAATLQQSTAESADQLQTNPQRFHSALSLMQGQIILIPGGLPLIIDNVIVGAVGSAGHRGDGDVRAAKAGIAAWEKYRQSKPTEGAQK